MTLDAITKTAQDVATAVKRQFGDESGVQLTDSDILRWINDAQRDINVKNRVLKASATADSVLGQSDYTLPSVEILSIESIHWNGAPLRALSMVEAEQYILSNPSIDTFNGAPTIWYEWAGSLTFWPTPVSSDLGVIRILYTRNTATVSTLGDALQLPDKYFNSIVHYVLVQAYEMDEDWDASSYKQQQLDKNLDGIADEENTTSNLTYPVIAVTTDY